MRESDGSTTVPAYIQQIWHKRELAASTSAPLSADNTRYSTSVGPMESEEIAARLSALRRKDCLYCQVDLRVKNDAYSRGEPTAMGRLLDNALWVQQDQISTYVCSACGWWCKWDVLHTQTSWEDDYFQTESCVEGVIRLFEIENSAVPLQALRLYLAKHPAAAAHVHPNAFEKLVGDVYRDFFECEVSHVGRAGDQGIDLVAIIAEEPTVLQVKRSRTGTLKDGPEIVRGLLGASVLAGANRAHLVTSAYRFTKATVDTAEQARKLSYHRVDIELVNLGDLLKMVRVANESESFVWRLAGD